MEKKCPYPNCHAPILDCQGGDEHFSDCDTWKEAQGEEVKKVSAIDDKNYSLSWTGNSFGKIDLSFITNRSTPIVVGVIGPEHAGKTTLLTIIYLLLSSGEKIGDWNFAGSYTIAGWENLAYYPRWKPGNMYGFPPRTSRSSGRTQGFLHLALRKNDITRDIIFIDAPGEIFSKWAVDLQNEGAKDAVWIHEKSDGFLMFIDSDAFTGSKRGIARHTFNEIASRLKDDLGDRPLAIVWSKADKKPEIRKETKDKIDKITKKYFDSFEEFDVSRDPAFPEMQKNITKMIAWLVDRCNARTPKPIHIEPQSEDYFLSYRNL